jgi:hypothetical protein
MVNWEKSENKTQSFSLGKCANTGAEKDKKHNTDEKSKAARLTRTQCFQNESFVFGIDCRVI